MSPRNRSQRLTVRLTEKEMETIRERASGCGKTITEFLVGRATGDAENAAVKRMGEDEKKEWDLSREDRLQLLRRLTVLIKMTRFMMSRSMEIPEKDVNVLMQQYIDAVKKEFPDRVFLQ